MRMQLQMRDEYFDVELRKKRLVSREGDKIKRPGVKERTGGDR